jgi:hypothetical protein
MQTFLGMQQLLAAPHLLSNLVGQAVALPHHHQVGCHGSWLSAQATEERLLSIVMHLQG